MCGAWGFNFTQNKKIECKFRKCLNVQHAFPGEMCLKRKGLYFKHCKPHTQCPMGVLFTVAYITQYLKCKSSKADWAGVGKVTYFPPISCALFYLWCCLIDLEIAATLHYFRTDNFLRCYPIIVYPVKDGDKFINKVLWVTIQWHLNIKIILWEPFSTKRRDQFNWSVHH